MEKWGSRLGFILATIGSAVGIGNIWRFSSVVSQNGGGAYLIPYFIAVIGFGVPLMILELAAGRTLKCDVVSIFRKIDSRFEIFGWVIWAVVFAVLSYYLVIVGWTLAYFTSALIGEITVFPAFTATLNPVLFFVITTILTGVVVSQGIKKGIERVTTLLIPFAFLLLIGMAAYSIILPGFAEGLSYLFTPDYSVLSDPLIWSAAIGQAFFSLSVGFGTLITYGHYLDDRTNIPQSSLIITIADLSAALLSGIVIFPIVFSYGLSPTMGTELAFVSLPQAFNALSNGRLLAIAFFLLIFLAGFTSAVSMLEVNISVFEEKLTIPRKKSAAILVALSLLLGLPSALSYSQLDLRLFGLRFLDLMDETVGTLGLPITALIISIVMTWFVKKDLIDSITNNYLLNTAIRYSTKYFIPVLLFIIISAKLLVNVDFSGWHLMQNIPFIGNILELEFIVMMGIALLIFYYLFMRTR